MSESPRPPGWLPKPEYDSIYSRVPRLCVEVVISTRAQGVLLTRRDIPPNIGAWHIPGGTVHDDGMATIDTRFRVSVRYETSDAEYAWLNRIVAVASAIRLAHQVVYDAYVLR